MKKFDIFWFLFIFTGNFGTICLLLIPLQLEMKFHLIATIILAVLFSKLETDKADLENKIFELKQLIEDGTKKS